MPSCCERIAEKKKIHRDKAERYVLKMDKRRDKFLKRVYPANVHASASYDLTLNTDDFTVPQAVEVVLFAMQQRGYDVPEPELAT